MIVVSFLILLSVVIGVKITINKLLIKLGLRHTVGENLVVDILNHAEVRLSVRYKSGVKSRELISSFHECKSLIYSLIDENILLPDTVVHGTTGIISSSFARRYGFSIQKISLFEKLVNYLSWYLLWLFHQCISLLFAQKTMGIELPSCNKFNRFVTKASDQRREK